MDPIESLQRFESQKQKVQNQKEQKTKIKMKRDLNAEE